MDSITQVTLGAAVGEHILVKKLVIALLPGAPFLALCPISI